MSASASAAEGEGTPAQPASEKEPEMPGPREESEEEEDEDDDEEEEEEKEKSLIVEGKREKKKVERLTMQVSSLQREPFTIAQGKGQKLCEIERIHFFLSKKKTDELRNLHKLLYNRPGTVSSLKKNVGQFSGFPFEKGSVQYKKKEEMLKKFRNAMLKSICEVLDLERSGVNSELVKRILNFLMHPKPSGKPLPKSKKTSSKGSKKERNSSGMARKAKRTKCPEILSDESSSDEDEKKNKEESSDDEDKESEEEPPKKTAKREKPKQKATSKSKKSVKSANVKKADSSTTKKNQNSSKKGMLEITLISNFKDTACINVLYIVFKCVGETGKLQRTLRGEVIQVEHPLSEMLGTGSDSDFDIYIYGGVLEMGPSLNMKFIHVSYSSYIA
ncbi:PREDICTED: protein DEK isoform X1 [Colobus angolensis palliatus]|uniref:protein DEK isoform X1 n=1 Tax=Colobus angolensis palliatus TaxID=336983 RepID=UPI0005F478FD|nr:PREDICTED: protein DEK isoform X1 [Colobus angolensis palliatus]